MAFLHLPASNLGARESISVDSPNENLPLVVFFSPLRYSRFPDISLNGEFTCSWPSTPVLSWGQS
ncbi:unnamed protein product [Linum tenue]|uniref:Uncharacterized protein n=1 Tax=Linum tenue TaxID=586396 RepID=A0AAV0QRG7_9ROSI|nr:unnamed protein product [Linum tenue]